MLVTAKFRARSGRGDAEVAVFVVDAVQEAGHQAGQLQLAEARARRPGGFQGCLDQLVNGPTMDPSLGVDGECRHDLAGEELDGVAGEYARNARRLT